MLNFIMSLRQELAENMVFGIEPRDWGIATIGIALVMAPFLAYSTWNVLPGRNGGAGQSGASRLAGRGRYAVAGRTPIATVRSSMRAW